MKFRSNLCLTVATLCALVLTSCGANNKAIIATAVAQTVQAQSTQVPASTDTPMPTATGSVLLTDTPVLGTPANTPAIPTVTPAPALPTPPGGYTQCTADATFVSETVPDGTIVQPGAQFLKSWQIQNTGTCPWDSTWKFVYVSGDLMGAAFTYPLPATPPKSTMNFAITLTAPTDYGSHTGYWKLESPWGLVFGDSDSGNPFWVTVNVNSGTPGAKTPTVFGITSLTYSDYYTGTCLSANLFFYISATISVSGPVTVTVYWHHSDGPNVKVKNLVFDDAGTQTVTDVWSQKVGSPVTSLWDQIIETAPVNHQFPKHIFLFPCH